MTTAAATGEPSSLDLRLRLAALSVSIVGQLGLLFSAFLLPLAMAQGHVDSERASGILALEFAVYFFSALLASSVKRFRPDRVALIGCLAYACGSFGAAIANEPTTFAAARMLCGLAGGVVMVSANRAIASHHDYARIVAFVLIGTSIFGVAALVIVPAIFQFYGSAPTYAVLGLTALIAAALTPWLTTGSRVIATSSMRFGTAAFMLLAAYFFSRLSDAALWPYNERFGNRVGLDTVIIGLVFAGSAIISVAGPILALRVRGAAAIMLLFSAVLLAKAAAPTLMTAMPSPASFVIAQMIVTVTYVTAGQIFLSHFSAIDASGRLAGLAGTVGLGADAAGLGVSGQSYALGSFEGIAIASATLGVIACALAIAALVRGRFSVSVVQGP